VDGVIEGRLRPSYLLSKAMAPQVNKDARLSNNMKAILKTGCQAARCYIKSPDARAAASTALKPPLMRHTATSFSATTSGFQRVPLSHWRRCSHSSSTVNSSCTAISSNSVCFFDIVHSHNSNMMRIAEWPPLFFYLIRPAKSARNTH
jgi:hypothetical protein